MFDFLTQNDIYIVLIVSSLLWLGFSLLIWRHDNRIKALEEATNQLSNSKKGYHE